MTKMKLFCRNLLLAGVMPLALAACGGAGTDTAEKGGETATAEAPALDPILANPQVGDLFAAELTSFSAANFNQTGQAAINKAYGLMKIVEVQDDRVIAITEQGAWPNPNGARNDLNGDLADITWDESERIPIKREDFARLVEEDKILETRRMSGN